MLGTIERSAEPVSSGLLLIQVEDKIFEEIYANNKTVGKKLRYWLFSEEMKKWNLNFLYLIVGLLKEIWEWLKGKHNN